METNKRQHNMSDFLANLNAPSQQPEVNNDFDDTNLFTQTDFFDFDFADPSSGFSRAGAMDSQTKAAANMPSWNEQSSPDFLSGDFKFNAFNDINNIIPSNANPNSLQSPTSTSSPTSNANVKRKAVALDDPVLTLEERTRYAAEEDKRRRNTAASARFRVKKKQREQALEKTAREMTEKATRLEKRVAELEMENRWLKGLITEKTGGEKMNELWTKYLAEGGDKADASKKGSEQHSTS